MSDEVEKPYPGSKEATDQGCTCPVLDNHKGLGRAGNQEVFVMNADCPIHGEGENN